jgi:acetyl-CoA carboxylase biotin carboxyl carrier protein
MITKTTPRHPGPVPGAGATDDARPVDDPASTHSWPDTAFAYSSKAAELEVVLAAVRYNALALHENAPRPPSHVRVAAGDIVVELTWAENVEAGPDRGVFLPDLPRPRPRPEAAPTDGAVDRPADRPVGARPAGDNSAGGHGFPADGGAANLTYLTAPSVGVFYHSSEPGAAPFVQVGDHVTVGQQVGILEVMKLMIPIEAEIAGRIVEVCQPNATSVEYGERLLGLDRASDA